VHRHFAGCYTECIERPTPHVWQIFAGRLDEGEQAIQKIGAFVRRHTT